ncbi:response regulator [Lichenicoccus sp.]|uniref:response regulator n=1 Tax=Lichenicoccus sp. TaxID=2781899 RepID=UPI003D125179
MSGALILVVDDEPQIHRFLRPALEAAGYSVARADTAAEGLRLAASRSPDAVLLDLGLPDLDGQEALGRLRAFSAVPVLMLTARDREADKIAALDAGADDYVEKPFAVGELLARIRAALRHGRSQAGVPEVLAVPGFEINFARRQARAGDAALALSPREWSLLELLARNAGRVLTHRQLLTAVWGPAHTDDVQYLRVYVAQLRAKLGPAARLLRTEAGVGYRLEVTTP